MALVGELDRLLDLPFGRPARSRWNPLPPADPASRAAFQKTPIGSRSRHCWISSRDSVAAAGIGNGMAAITVGDGLDQRRTLAPARALAVRRFHRALDGEEIHPIDPLRRDAVGIGLVRTDR